MKRYVKELAQDIIKNNSKNKLMNPFIKQKIRQKIDDILRCYERNLLTDIEAVKAIVGTISD